MKKVITVLAILVVLTSAIFAETHTVKVKADVVGQDPAFQLHFLGENTNDGASVFAAAGSYDSNFDTEAEAVDVTFDLDEGGDVTVTAVLANKAQKKQGYLLTFSNGVFSVTRNETAGTLVPTITTTAGAVITGTSSVAKTDDAVVDAPVRVAFNGTKVTATNPVLATAVYHYTADPTINPGTYYADITLTIAAN